MDNKTGLHNKHVNITDNHKMSHDSHEMSGHADIILVESNPKDVSSLILFGRATYRKMIQNLIWATGYNVFAMPLAAGVFYWAGIIISPAAGAVLMSLSTIIVAINARLLKLK